MASDFAGGEVFARLSLKPRSRSRKVARPLDFGGEAPGIDRSPAPSAAPLQATEAIDPPEPADVPAEEHVLQGPEFGTSAAGTDADAGSSSGSEDCPINLRDIVRRVGGDLYEGGSAALIPAPGQSRLTRGLVLRLAPDGRSIIWEALQKCSRQEIESYLQHACGLAAKA